MGKIVKRAYKFRFTPDPYQETQMLRTFGCVRLVYNKALDLTSRAYQEHQISLTYGDTSKALTAWKQEPEFAFLNDVSAVALQQSLKHLDSARQRFFQKIANYPRFKSRRKSRKSYTLMKNGFQFWKDEDGNPHLKLAKQKMELNIIWHRQIPDSEPSQVTVSQDRAGRWFLSLLFEENIEPQSSSDTIVGIDVGIGNTLAAVWDGSNGTIVSNPRHYRKQERKLARAQASFSRKQKGSNNQLKARLRVAKISARIADSRRNDLHQLTTQLVNENQVLVVETLNIEGMKRNHSNAKSVSDASMSELLGQLTYKAEWYGRTIIFVDRWFPSSQLCSNCLWQYRELSLSEREWICQNCGSLHDRDINAAKNLRAAGTAVIACGTDVSLEEMMAHMRAQSPAAGKQELLVEEAS